MPVLVVLIGTRGAGKSTTLDFIRRQGYFVLTPSTNRPRRSPKDTEYSFENKWEDLELAWEIEVGRYKYGMRESEIDEAIKNQIGVTVFEPGGIDVLERFKAARRLEVVTIGLDTIESIEEQERRIGGDAARVVIEDKLASDRKVVQKCDAVFSGTERDVGDAVVASCKVLSSRGGVLDGDAIRSLLGGRALLTDVDENNVQSASYDLRLGREAWCQGGFVFLDETNPTLKIPAYSYAIVTAQEEARLPRFVTARYDLTVSGFMDGLILSNGPQVDPGYQGSLFCILFNGRDVARGVTLGRHFATIEFVTTTTVAEGYSGGYQGKKGLAAFVSENTAVSPGGNIVERIDNLETSIDKKVAPVRQFWFSSLTVVILIHLTIAGWLWFGGPNLSEWLTGCKDPAAASRSMEKPDGGRESSYDKSDVSNEEQRVETIKNSSEGSSEKRMRTGAEER